MAKLALNRFAALVIAIQLALTACGPGQIYENPQRPPEETAILVNTWSVYGEIEAQINSIDGQSADEPFGRLQVPILPGMHTFRASWYRDENIGRSREPKGFMDYMLAPIIIPLVLIALPFGAGEEESPDYEETRDFVATLEAGKEYDFEVYSEDSNQVFLWIQDSKTGAVVGGAKPICEGTVNWSCEAPDPNTATLSGSPTSALWNGKWFAKDGAWSLYLDVENGAFTGRMMRRGSDPFPVTGTISSEHMIAGRVNDGGGESAGSLSGMFPNVSVYQDGEVRASFDLARISQTC